MKILGNDSREKMKESAGAAIIRGEDFLALSISRRVCSLGLIFDFLASEAAKLFPLLVSERGKNLLDLDPRFPGTNEPSIPNEHPLHTSQMEIRRGWGIFSPTLFMFDWFSHFRFFEIFSGGKNSVLISQKMWIRSFLKKERDKIDENNKRH